MAVTGEVNESTGGRRAGEEGMGMSPLEEGECRGHREGRGWNVEGAVVAVVDNGELQRLVWREQPERGRGMPAGGYWPSGRVLRNMWGRRS